jgi:ATP-dependent DNA helicase DinG
MPTSHSGSKKNKVLWSSRFTPEARDQLVLEISQAEGREVFGIGTIDTGGKICELEIVARGSQDAVPALSSYFEKGSVLVHNHPSGKLFPSDADVQVAAEAGSFGVGSYIVDNEVNEVYVVAEPARKKALRTLNEESMAGTLDKGGTLARLMPSFETRPSQVAMTRDVAATFNDGGVLVAEAGTGVGKSFAYLLPSLAWAQGNEEKVVVSTATINLQDQLFTKDIPLMTSIFKKKPKTVLVKGRSNYICSRKLRETIEEEGLGIDEDHSFKKLLDWDMSGTSGDRAELSFRVDDAAWNRVCSEADSCLSLLCPFRERCHVIAVRKEAASAQIIIVNHHLLFADVSSRQRASGLDQTAILPAYSALILDEAHSIESSATSLFTESVTRFSVIRKLARLLRRNRKGHGQFGALSKLASLPGVGKKILDSFDAESRRVHAALSDLEMEGLRLLGGETSLRLKERSLPVEEAFCEPIGRLQRSILAVIKMVSDVLLELSDDMAQDPAVYETKIALRSLSDISELLGRMKDFNADPATIFWLEKSKTSQKEVFVSFNATPLEVSEILEKSVFGKIRTVICTSATLAVANSFNFWMKRVGIAKDREDVVAKIYPSPFPFSSNTLLAVDPDAPHPQNSKEQYKEYLGKAVVELLIASRGRALVLFTSYELLGYCFEKARLPMEKAKIACLRQGMDDRSKLLSMFKSDISSVLFATDSFWEGVDAPGETLSLVIISKLPFRVPNDPIQQARAEAVENNGGNSFAQISVPEAIIKFKQGFGRLIRHSEDRGVAVVLDKRLVASRYGALFVESLPSCKLLVDKLPAIASEVSRFLD